MQNDKLPVAIIGGGPVGLAAAAQLAKRSIPFLLFEAGAEAGSNIQTWAHVRVFSPWRYNIDKNAESLLQTTGWQAPDPEALPTGGELVEQYLKPLSAHPDIRPFVLYNSKVQAVGRKNMDKMKTQGRHAQPFSIQVIQNGVNTLYEARAVIDASGAWQNPNPLGAGGLPAFGETENRAKVFYGIPDVFGSLRDRYKNKNVLVVGGGHSAINTLLELNRLKTDFPDTQIHWILRKTNLSDAFGGGENDALPARGALGTDIKRLVKAGRVNVYTPFHITEIENEAGALNIVGEQNGAKKALYGIDEIVANTGVRPDLSFLREVRVDVDSTVESVPALADLIDPNLHSCGTVRPHGERELRQREKDFYIAGMKSYGRAPTFLMATGYEQVRSVVAALAGDRDAAERVELELPETGVCNIGTVSTGVTCCG